MDTLFLRFCGREADPPVHAHLPETIALPTFPLDVGRVPRADGSASAVLQVPGFLGNLISRNHASLIRPACSSPVPSARPPLHPLHSPHNNNPDAGISIVDHNSKNGTFVNGVRIPPSTQHPLKLGDRLCFGAVNGWKTSPGQHHSGVVNSPLQYVLQRKDSPSPVHTAAHAAQSAAATAAGTAEQPAVVTESQATPVTTPAATAPPEPASAWSDPPPCKRQKLGHQTADPGCSTTASRDTEPPPHPSTTAPPAQPGASAPDPRPPTCAAPAPTYPPSSSASSAAPPPVSVSAAAPINKDLSRMLDSFLGHTHSTYASPGSSAQQPTQQDAANEHGAYPSYTAVAATTPAAPGPSLQSTPDSDTEQPTGNPQSAEQAIHSPQSPEPAKETGKQATTNEHVEEPAGTTRGGPSPALGPEPRRAEPLADARAVDMDSVADAKQGGEAASKAAEVGLDESVECCICRGALALAAIVDCGHCFCWVCITQWCETFESKAGPCCCPTCRAGIEAAPRRCVALDRLAEAVVAARGPDDRQEWQDRLTHGRRLLAQGPPPVQGGGKGGPAEEEGADGSDSGDGDDDDPDVDSDDLQHSSSNSGLSGGSAEAGDDSDDVDYDGGSRRHTSAARGRQRHASAAVSAHARRAPSTADHAAPTSHSRMQSSRSASEARAPDRGPAPAAMSWTIRDRQNPAVAAAPPNRVAQDPPASASLANPFRRSQSTRHAAGRRLARRIVGSSDPTRNDSQGSFPTRRRRIVQTGLLDMLRHQNSAS